MRLEKEKQALTVFLLPEGGYVRALSDPECFGRSGRFEEFDAVRRWYDIIRFAADDDQ